MKIRQHRLLWTGLPLVIAAATFLVVTFVRSSSVMTPDLVTGIICGLSFLGAQFAVGFLPVECPKCGKRLKFQRSLDNSEGSGVRWFEYYCFKCKRVAAWQRQDLDRDW